MTYEDMVDRMASVAAQYATLFGVAPPSFAAKAANEVPPDYRGDALREFRKACDTTARKLDGGLRLDRPDTYALKVFRSYIANAKSTQPAGPIDPFVAETLRDIEQADAEIRRMPQARHDRVRAIEHWRAHGGPTPYWALYGYDGPEAYTESLERARAQWRAERGLGKPMPKGVQGIGAVIQHSQTLRDLDAEINGDDS